MIPPVSDRETCMCNDDLNPCMFLTAGYECMLPACQYYKPLEERCFDRFIYPCNYHMTPNELKELIDSQ